MKIISLAPSNTEILYRLGLGDEIVAVTSLCDNPAEVRDKETIGGWTSGIDFERIREINPDIVLASDSLQDEVVSELDDQQILQVKPNTVEEVYESIQKIGEKTGKKEEARELVENIRKDFDRLGSADGERVYCEEWSSPPMVSGNWIPGLLERINCKYFTEEGERSRKFDLEELKDFDPEYIFLNVCGAGEKAEKDSLMKRDDWQDITAVKNGDVYVIDDALLNRPGPRLVKGAEKILEKIRKNKN